ncbi:MAG: SLC13 family permease [Terriglobales bacterium]
MSPWLAPHTRDLAVAVIFAASYFVFAVGRLPGTQIRRSAMAVIGAALIFALGALPGAAALHAVDFPTLILLFAMMIIVAALHQAGFFDWAVALVVARVRPDHLLPTVLFTAGVLSAFLVNDVVCLLLAPLILQIAKAMRRDPVAYLLALAIGSNIGSLATITGNPQDILIASISGLGYRAYLVHLAPVALVGLFVAWAFLHGLERPTAATPGGARCASVPSAPAGGQPALARSVPAVALSRGMVPALVILALVMAGFLLGVPPALAAVVGAALLLILRHRDAAELCRQVDWGLLLLFIGLFLLIAGAQNAGLLGWLAQWSRGPALRNAAGFTAFVAVLSNIVSNVPAVMLLKAPIAHFAHAAGYWLLLAMASTLSGNLTLTGSIANFIVVERARPDASIGFWRYFRSGFPIAVTTLALGYFLLRLGW